MRARFFTWRTARRVGMGLAILATILAALYLEEDWRGRRAWQQYKGELEQHGEQLEGRSFIPPSVPDEQNFAMAPVLAPLNDYVSDPKSGTEVPRDAEAVERLKRVNLSKLNPQSELMPSRSAWQTGKLVSLQEWQRWLNGNGKGAALIPTTDPGRDVLTWLTRFSAEMNEFNHAAERPLSRFPLQYEKGFAMPLRHSGVLFGFAGVCYLRSLGELETGDTAAALQDIRTIDRIGAAFQTEPLLISHLVRLSVIGDIPQILWRGMVQQRWKDDQLRSIQEILGRLDLLVDQQRVMRGERAIFNDYCDQLRREHADLYSKAALAAGITDERPRSATWIFRLLPQRALLYQNQVCLNRWMQEFILPVIDPEAGRVYPRRQIAGEEISRETKPTLYNWLAKIVFPVYPSITIRTAATHVSIREGVVACALERFRLKTGKYPESLRELLPDYLAQPVNDIFVDEPLHYRREPAGGFILYSVGWNGLDDQGEVVGKAGSVDRRDNEAGDWVWFGTAKL